MTSFLRACVAVGLGFGKDVRVEECDASPSWLGGAAEQTLVAPAPHALLDSHWANPRVNRSRREDPACLKVPAPSVEGSRA